MTDRAITNNVLIVDEAGKPVGVTAGALNTSGAGGGGGAATIADGADVAQGTTTDAASVSTVIGLLKKLNTNLFAEDVASTTGDLLSLAGFVRQDALSSLVNTDGDYALPKLDALGRHYVTYGPPLEVSFTTTTSQALATTDVGAYSWVSVHVTSRGTSSNSVAQGSNDNTNWIDIPLLGPTGGTTNAITQYATAISGASLVYYGPLNFRYFRINVTGIAGGTTAGVIEFFPNAKSAPISAVLSNPADANAAASAATVASFPSGFNGTSWDRMRLNQDVTLLASASRTTTQTVADQVNYNGRGVQVVLDMTVVGTGSVTLEIDAKDVASGKYVSLLTGAAVVTNTTNIYTVYPGVTVAANAAASTVLPRTWRVVVTANNANAATYSVGASVLL